jgi:hypothetical protein
MRAAAAGTRDVSKLGDMGQYVGVMKDATEVRDRVSLLGMMQAVGYSTQGQCVCVCM